MQPEDLLTPCCVTTECSLIGQPDATDKVLSVVVLFDHPFDTVSLNEVLFSLAVQDYENLDVMVVLPDAGPELHRCVENAVLAQPWLAQTRLRVTSVSVRASRTISAHLVNAGLRQATGRYIALIHHQDLVYQHAYRMLIERLNGAAVAFGGVRVATHSYGQRHWMVTGKEQAEAGQRAIHAFVADRKRLDPDYLTVPDQPTSPTATTAFLMRLAGHPKADFSLAGVRMFESRTPPRHSTAELDLGQLPSPEMMKTQAEMPPAKQGRSIRTKVNYKEIPIFINARDLFVSLRQLVMWLLEAGYTCIYVIDNESSYPALLDFYNTMRKDIRVIRVGMNLGHTAIWHSNILDQLGIIGPYVWTDPDIVPIKECPTNVLEFFLAVLQVYPNKTKVGFGLRIDDLPEHYRFKREVIAWETQYWEKKIGPKLYDAPIDTTFALYRAGSGYKPINAALRTGFPYLARHVPWYENLDRPSDDHDYYLKNAKPGINSWGGDKLPSYLHNCIQQLLDWRQFRGRVQQQWGKLTDDDLDQVEGRRVELIGKIQERYGIAKDAAEEQVDAWLRNI